MTNKERELRLELAYEQLDKVCNDLLIYDRYEQVDQLDKIMEQLIIFSKYMRCEE